MRASYDIVKGWTVNLSNNKFNNKIEDVVKNESDSVEASIIYSIRSILGLYEQNNTDSELAAAYNQLFPDAMSRVDALALTLKLAGTNLFLPTEFLEYELYNKTKAEQKSYISQLHMYKLWEKLNKMNCRLKDKNEINDEIRASLGAEYTTYDYPVKDAYKITEEEMKAAVPFFAKPIDGVGGKGCFKVTKYHRLSKTFTTNIGKYTYKELQRKMDYVGYILQKLEKSDFVPYFAKKSLGLNTLRFVTVRGNIIGAVFKIATNYNLVDNFGVSGNYAAAIDLDTGKLHDSMYQGKDYTFAHFKMIKDDIKIPEWDSLCVFVEKVAKQFKHIKLIGFDIAITKRGPVIIDLNTTPGVRLLQIPYQMGFKNLIK